MEYIFLIFIMLHNIQNNIEYFELRHNISITFHNTSQRKRVQTKSNMER